MSDLQLSYSFQTEPGVLQAGNEGRLTIVVSNAKAPLTLNGIDFVLTQGTGARDIDNGVTPTTPSLPDGWTYPSPSGGLFAMTPAAPLQIGRYGLIFVFDLTVSDQVGTAFINITEHLEVDGVARANRGTLAVPKFPQTFKLDSFYSTTPIVNQGDSLNLVWTGENLHLADYSISYTLNDQTVVVDIPANTYSYRLDAIGVSSVFYLHVKSSDSPDISITFQSSEYPITVNPAIAEFWADKSVAAPGAIVGLNWQVAASVSSATIVCLQSGSTWNLDAAGLAADRLAITLPAISMSAQYVFQAFDSSQGGANPAMVASRTLTIAVSANIPFVSSAYAQLLTDPQAADLASNFVARSADDTVMPQLVEQIFAAFRTGYPGIDFYLDWSNDAANARSFVYIDGRKKVVLFGGLVRVPCLYYEAICFIVAQCVARFSGEQPVDSNNFTYAGIADYYATSMILGRVFYAISSNSELINGVADQIKTLFQTGISTTNQQGDPNNLAGNPGIHCRYGAIKAGMFGSPIPACTTGAA